ncbi:MAG: hypothetical protein CEO22_232 [Candidatus Berkelbacteria bacterium Gr01-1014_85]|uniref:Uncharacterized protein n=1 Tax=Candidatus Berkelbacteria bacterium Gr01-1014_85 TaxID=2017150 RepID=A0A554JCJ3_9BACT|nr:MAG: hypothetical protein CEO22_232 [Candidatus Berkelbacteria bacterium Gr01-1014_85]
MRLFRDRTSLTLIITTLIFLSINYDRALFKLLLTYSDSMPEAYLIEGLIATGLCGLGVLLLRARLAWQWPTRLQWFIGLSLTAISLTTHWLMRDHFFYIEEYIWLLSSFHNAANDSLATYGQYYHFFPFILVRSWFGEQVGPFVFTSLVLHSLVGITVYILVNKLTEKPWLSWTTAAIYLTLPSYLDGTRWFFVFMGNSWILLGLLMSLYYYWQFLENEDKRPLPAYYYWLSLLIGAYILKIGLVRAAILPLAIAMFELIRLKSWGWPRLKRIAVRLLPFGLLALFFYLQSQTQLNNASANQQLTPMLFLGRSLASLTQLLPAELYVEMNHYLISYEWFRNLKLAGTSTVAIGAILLWIITLLPITLTIRDDSRSKLAWLAWGWLIILFLPSMISGPQLPQAIDKIDTWFVSDLEYMPGSRYLQTSAIGLAMLLAIGLDKITENALVIRWPKIFKPLSIFFRGLITAGLVLWLGRSSWNAHTNFTQKFSLSNRRYIEQILALIPRDGKVKFFTEARNDKIEPHGPIRGIFLGHNNFEAYYSPGELKYFPDVTSLTAAHLERPDVPIYAYTWDEATRSVTPYDKDKFITILKAIER